MSSENKDINVTFSDPRFGMTLAGRILIRIIKYVFYLTLIATTVVLLISDISRLFYLGLLLCLFCIDIFIHRNEGDSPFVRLKKSGTVNLAKAIRPQAFSVLERAYDRSIIT